MLEEMKYEQKILLNEIQKKLMGSETTVKGLPEDCPTLPMHTPEDLEHFNKYLEKEEKFSHVCKYLGTVGGFNVKDATRRTLQMLLTNDLAKRYNWKGTGGVKLAFSSATNIVKLISSSLRLHANYKATTDHDVEVFIKTWLIHANDRDGGRAIRAKTIVD